MRILLAVIAILATWYGSLILSSRPLDLEQRESVGRAIAVLEAKGFDREVFLLRHVVAFRSTDHWLNRLTNDFRSFAATNFPFEIITIGPDFYNETFDDTERAMILLHEAQHLQGGSEVYAFKYVWQNRRRLGWTRETHGDSPNYYSFKRDAQEAAPELFTCPERFESDCTETETLSYIK